MNFETYLSAVLDCNLPEVKDEVKEIIIKKILEYKDPKPQGEWIEFDDGSVACPVCGTGTSIKSIPSVIFFRYCPYCGAKMGRSEEE
jgi:uncharacterized protein (UPF0212 family)